VVHRAQIQEPCSAAACTGRMGQRCAICSLGCLPSSARADWGLREPARRACKPLSPLANLVPHLHNTGHAPGHAGNQATQGFPAPECGAAIGGISQQEWPRVHGHGELSVVLSTSCRTWCLGGGLCGAYVRPCQCCLVPGQIALSKQWCIVGLPKNDVQLA